jgi:hypothetical protein
MRAFADSGRRLLTIPDRKGATVMLQRAGLVAMLTSLALLLVASAGAGRSPICTQGMTTVEVDPRGLLPLTGANPIGPATTAALRHSKASSRPQVVSALLATMDRQRGREAKFECGTRVYRRTVVVYLTDRAALPSQSLSQRVFFVGRFRSGYRVWQVVH